MFLKKKPVLDPVFYMGRREVTNKNPSIKECLNHFYEKKKTALRFFFDDNEKKVLGKRF